MATKGPKLTCQACNEDVRLHSLVENDGLIITCNCDDPRHSLDSLPYELGIGDTSEDWEVSESTVRVRESQAGLNVVNRGDQG